jgi:hypothetical protein
MPGLKVAKLYGDDSDAKVIAASKFQNEQADYAIATIGSMGTGGQLDDKRGPKYNGKPRTNIWASLPIRADDFLQAVARAWRINTASEVDNIFALTNHGADRYAQESLLRSLKLQEAFVDSGSFGEISRHAKFRRPPNKRLRRLEELRLAQRNHCSRSRLLRLSL